MRLHFCKNNASLAARLLTAPADVMIMRTGRDVPLAIKALSEGRDVLAIANNGTAIGWRAPAGTVLTLDEGIDEKLAEQARGRLREPYMQHESRIFRVGQKPVQIQTIGLDDVVLQAKRIFAARQQGDEVTDPFSTKPEIDDGPSGSQF